MSNKGYRFLGLKAFILLLVSTLLLIVVFSATVFADTPFTITSSGVGYYNIVLCNNATTVEQTAANELQTYIQKVTGVTLPIVTENDAQDKSFMVGPTAFAIANGVNPTGAEQWAIKNVGNRIIVTGGRPRGTLYAVYYLLEDEIGIRWWSEWEEYVPSIPTLTINNPINKSGTPAFTYRELCNGCHTVETNSYSLFYVHNRLNGYFAFTPAAYGGTVSYGLPCHVHTVSRILLPEQYYASHPEYFALVGGERKRNGQLCLSNSDVITLFKQKLRDNIAASYAEADSKGLPRPTMFSISPNDATGFCECDSCQAQIGSYGYSGYLLTFVNALAADIAITYPEVKIDTLAYWYFIDLPTGGVTPRSNVQIRYANVSLDLLHPLSHANNAGVRSKLEAWKNITSNDFIFWDYAINYYPNPPTPTMYNKQQDYQYLRSKGVTGIFEEHECVATSDMWDMKAWIEAKLMENPDLDLNTLITDFTDKYYGPAGSYIRQYLTQSKALADATNNKITFGSQYDKYNYFTLDYVNAQEQILNNAAAAVASESNPVLLQRVNAVRASLDRLILIRWYNLSGEAYDRGITRNFDRQTSSTRLLHTLKQQKVLRCLGDSDGEQCGNCKDVDAQISSTIGDISLLVPSDLASVPYGSLIDIPSENFRLYNGHGGLGNVTDMDAESWPNHSLLGHAARVKLSDIDNQADRDLHKPLIDIGLYNSADGTRLLRQLSVSDITPNVYKLYKVGTAQIKQNDYLYLFRSWSVQVDFNDYLQGKPEQKYDIYVSMKFKGPSYGGSSSDSDCIYIDRVILVGKGTLPSELSSISPANMTDFSPEEFTISGPVSLTEEQASLVGRTAKVSLTSLSSESERNYYLPSVPVGLYNSTNGTRVLRQIALSDIKLNQYKLYKVENVKIQPNDYLYLFGSWVVHVPVSSARSSDPNQLYDIYVSMKFEGPAYGGDLTKKDAVYVDRVVVVRSTWKNESENLTVNAISPGVTHTVTTEGNMSGGYGDKLNAYAADKYIEYSIPVNETGTYDVKVKVNKDTDGGIFQLAIDGTNLGAAQDDYSSSYSFMEYDLGNVTFSTTGNKLFRFTITGKNANSSGYKLFTDYIELTKMPSTWNETESLMVNATSTGDTHAVTNDSSMSSGKGDIFNANETNDYIEYSIPVNETGTYDVKVKANKSADSGMFQFAIDGTNLGASQDNYSSSSSYAEYDLGYVTFTTTGNKLLRFSITGKNANSSGYKLFTDYIKLSRMPSLWNETESLSVNAISPGVSHTITTESKMSYGYGDKLNANAANNYIEYSVPVNETGTYVIRVEANKDSDGGIFQLAIDGTNLGTAQDNYSSNYSFVEYVLGNVTFTTTGNKLFRFTITGKNASSSGYKLFTDYIRLVKIPAPSKNETESLTVNAISSGVSHTYTNENNMSGGYGDKFNAFEADKYIEYSVPVSETGTYAIKVKANKSTDSGIFQLSIDGTNLGAVQDTWSSVNTYEEYDLGNVTFTTTGNKLFRFTITGKNAGSSGYKLFTDYISLVKQ